MPRSTTDVWNISEQDFPAGAPIETQLRFLLRYAILAPSVKNSQPWIFQVESGTVRIFADPERALAVTDPDQRELYISLGCALENLLVAAEHFGLGHEVTYFPEPDRPELAASVAFAPGGTPSPVRAGITLDAIAKRHNDNSVYRFVPVPEEVCRRLDRKSVV